MTTIDTGTDELLCELADGVATVTLNKPDKRNALGDILTPALRAVLLTLEEHARCGAVVITGAGRAFCAGGMCPEWVAAGVRQTLGRARRKTRSRISCTSRRH